MLVHVDSQLINDPYYYNGITPKEYEAAVLQGGKHNCEMRTVIESTSNGYQFCGVGFVIVTWADEIFVQSGSDALPFVETYLIFLPAASLCAV